MPESGNILTGSSFDVGGDLASWTQVGSAWEVVASHGSTTPQSGAGFAKPTDGSGSPAEIQQTIDITPAIVTNADIDGGFVSFEFEVWIRTRGVGDTDTVRVIVETLTDGLVVTDTFDSGELDPNNTWNKHTVQATLVTGDRQMRVRLLGTLNAAGSGFNSYFDEASLNIITGLPQTSVSQMLDGFAFYNKFDGVSVGEPELAFDMTEGVFNGTAVRDASGKFGKAYRGTDGTANLAATTYPQVFGQPVSVSAWIYMEALPSAMFGAAVRSVVRIGDGTAEGLILGIVDATDNLVFQVVDTGLSVYTATMAITAPDLNTWIHVVGVATGGTIKIYKDGNLEDTTVLSGSIKYDTTPDLVIGENFEGMIDEVKIWTRELLLDDGGGFNEIQAAALEAEFLDTRNFIYPDFTDKFAQYLDDAFGGVASQLPELQDNLMAVRSDTAEAMQAIDGSSWEAVSTVSVTAATYPSVVYNPFTGYWLACDSLGHVHHVRTATDAWTDQGDITGGGVAIQKLIMAGDVVIAVGAGGFLATSPDGFVWTIRTSGVVALLKDAAWSGENWIVVGAGSTILTSPDLVTWTPRTTDAITTANAVAVAPAGLVVVVGAGGNIDVSTDHGATWSDAAPGTGADDLNDVAFGNHAFAAVGAAGTVIYGSVDASAWAAAASVPTANALSCVEHIHFDGWFAGGADGIITSTDADFWGSIATPVDGPISGIHSKVSAPLSGDLVKGQMLFNAQNYSLDFTTDKFPYTDSPFLFIQLPRNPEPNLTAADLDCDTTELTASVTYGPSDTVPAVTAYWEVEIELGVAYLRINQSEVALPGSGNTVVALSYTPPVGIDLSDKRIRYVIDAPNEPLQPVWMSAWITLADCTGGGGPPPSSGVGNTIVAPLVINIYDPVETSRYTVEIEPQIDTSTASDFWWESVRLDDDDVPPRIVDTGEKQLVLETMPPGRFHYRFTATFTGFPTQQQDFILLVRPDSDVNNV